MLFLAFRQRERRDDDVDYYSNRAILAPLNREVEKLNTDVLNQISGEHYIFLSADSIPDPAGANIIPIEYLNRLEPNGWPPHRLQLKIGAPITLLCNLDRSNGLCNGTRLLVERCSLRVIEATVMTGDHKGHRAFIPRIAITSQDAGKH